MRTLNELIYGVSPQNRSYCVGATFVITMANEAVATYERRAQLYSRTGEGTKIEECRLDAIVANYVAIAEEEHPWRDHGMNNPLEITRGEQLSSHQYSVNARLKHCLTKGQLHAFEKHVFDLARSVMQTDLRVAGMMKCSREILSVQAAVNTETAVRYTS